MDLVPLVVGSVLTAGSVWLMAGRKELADWLYEYYHSRPHPSWRPKWLPWMLRPTIRQTTIMVVGLYLLAFVLGVNGILLGLGVDFAISI